MRSRQKLTLILIGIAVLIAVALVAARFVGRLLIGGVNSLQTVGEAPLPTEEVWIAPTPEPLEDYAAREAQALYELPDPEPSPAEEEAEVSAPILESPEQLADTADSSSIVDDDLSGADVD